MFFKPWVGKKYKFGVNFGCAHTLIGAETFDGSPRYQLAILGLEHYCLAAEHGQNCNAGQMYRDSLQLLKNDCYLRGKQKRTRLRRLCQINSERRKMENDVSHFMAVLEEGLKKNFANIPLYDKEKKNISKKCWETDKKALDKIYVAWLWLQRYYDNRRDNSEDKKIADNMLKYQLTDLNSPWAQIMQKQNMFSLCFAMEKCLAVHVLLGEEPAEQEKETLNLIYQFNALSAELSQECRIHQCNIKDCENKECTKFACAKIYTCQFFTKQFVFNHTLGIINKKQSLYKFLPVIDPDKRNDTWDKVLFFNFYQRGMPYEKHKRNSDSVIRASDEEDALLTFAQNIKNPEITPKVLIVWGKDIKNSLVEGISFLQTKEGITLRRTTQGNFPFVHIDKCQRKRQKKISDFQMEFTVLDWKDTNGENMQCLVLFIDHPSQGFPLYNTRSHVRCAFQHYGRLIQWDSSLQLEHKFRLNVSGGFDPM